MGSLLMIFLFVMGLCLFAAVAALAAVLLTRRSFKDWQSHYTSEIRQWKAQAEAGFVYEPVDVQQGDFQRFMSDSGKAGSGYMRAEELVVPEDMKRRQRK